MNVTIWLAGFLMFNLACIIALNFIVLYVIMTNSKLAITQVDRLGLFIVCYMYLLKRPQIIVF